MKDRIISFFRIYIPSVLAGIAIAIGGCVYLSLDNKIVGAVSFSVGLYIICVHGLNLFTGKIGYLAQKNSKEFLSYCGTLLIIWFGNLTGTVLSGLLIAVTRINILSSVAATLCEAKLSDNFTSLFILGIFCGILMYAAVEGYKRCKNPLILIFCVAIFILCGFEHCIADMFYFAVSLNFNLKSLLVILIVTLGNSIGGMLLPFAERIIKKKESDL